MKFKTLSFLLLSALSASSQAHNIWFESNPTNANDFYLKFVNDDGVDVPYTAENIKAVQGRNAQGNLVEYKENTTNHLAHFDFKQPIALSTVAFDYGIWSEQPDGKYVKRPRFEVEGSPKAVWATKYHKSILNWNQNVIKPQNQALEFIPLSTKQPKQGQHLQIKILSEGQPAANLPVDFGGEGATYHTNAQGIVTLPVKPNRNIIWVGKRTPIVNDNRATESSIESTFLFYAKD